MKLFKISQDVNNDYDTFSDAVVAALDESDAKSIHPQEIWGIPIDLEDWNGLYSTWSPMEDVEAEYIGEAASNIERGVICASFHAG